MKRKDVVGQNEERIEHFLALLKKEIIAYYRKPPLNLSKAKAYEFATTFIESTERLNNYAQLKDLASKGIEAVLKNKAEWERVKAGVKLPPLASAKKKGTMTDKELQRLSAVLDPLYWLR